jgi:hypothetical protein
MRSPLALWRRLTTLPQRRLLDKLTLEEVVPVRLQMFEHLLKIGDVARLQKLQCVDSFEENPLCMWRERWSPPNASIIGHDELICGWHRPLIILRARSSSLSKLSSNLNEMPVGDLFGGAACFTGITEPKKRPDGIELPVFQSRRHV